MNTNLSLFRFTFLGIAVAAVAPFASGESRIVSSTSVWGPFGPVRGYIHQSSLSGDVLTDFGGKHAMAPMLAPLNGVLEAPTYTEQYTPDTRIARGFSWVNAGTPTGFSVTRNGPSTNEWVAGLGGTGWRFAATDGDDIFASGYLDIGEASLSGAVTHVETTSHGWLIAALDGQYGYNYASLYSGTSWQVQLELPRADAMRSKMRLGGRLGGTTESARLRIPGVAEAARLGLSSGLTSVVLGGRYSGLQPVETYREALIRNEGPAGYYAWLHSSYAICQNEDSLWGDFSTPPLASFGGVEYRAMFASSFLTVELLDGLVAGLETAYVEASQSAPVFGSVDRTRNERDTLVAVATLGYHARRDRLSLAVEGQVRIGGGASWDVPPQMMLQLGGQRSAAPNGASSGTTGVTYEVGYTVPFVAGDRKGSHTSVLSARVGLSGGMVRNAATDYSHAIHAGIALGDSDQPALEVGFAQAFARSWSMPSHRVYASILLKW